LGLVWDPAVAKALRHPEAGIPGVPLVVLEHMDQ